jgi:hypothetical protein
MLCILWIFGKVEIGNLTSCKCSLVKNNHRKHMLLEMTFGREIVGPPQQVTPRDAEGGESGHRNGIAHYVPAIAHLKLSVL